MSEHYDDKNSAEIQREIDHTRAEMSDTLEALRDRLSPGELVDQAVTYLKDGGAGQFTSNLSETIKQNPVPTALIGIGIAWLMMGGSREQHNTSSWNRSSGMGNRVSDTASSASERAGAMASSASERASGATSSASGRAGAMASSASERANAMMHSAREGGGRAREYASGMAHNTRQHVGEMAQGARHQVGETADRMQSQVRYQAERAKTSFSYLRDEHPLVLGALGFALGAALGAGLPPTAREDELMGEMRDEYLHQAREMGEEQIDKAKHVAAAAGRAAQEQLHDEGVTQGNADEQARQATETAERVVHASRDAAEAEAKNQGLTSSS